MSHAPRQLRQIFVLSGVLLVCSMLVGTGFTLWRTRADAIDAGFDVAALHAHSFEDLLTQNLHSAALIASGLSINGRSPEEVRSIFVATLRQTPYLRSISLANASGRIAISSTPDNEGMVVDTGNFLPPAPHGADILRIAPPWTGRDLAGGRPIAPDTPAPPDAPGLIPATVPVRPGNDHTEALFLALNPEHFQQHFSHALTAEQGAVRVYRYDGTLLLSSTPADIPGSIDAFVARDLKLGEVESGILNASDPKGNPTLRAFRASPIYPIVVVTDIDCTYFLRHWRAQGIALSSVVVAILFVSLPLALAYYRRQQQLHLQQIASERLQRINATVFDASTEATLIADNANQVISINSAFTEATGYMPGDILGQALGSLLDDEGQAALDQASQPHHATTPPAFEARLSCSDGQTIWTEILSTPQVDGEGRTVGYHHICRNISARKSMEEQIRQLAFYDPLTRLANRRLFVERLTQAIAADKRNGTFSALLFLDLDNFKPLNDHYGHKAGDVVLVEMASRMKACVRAIDTIGRFGGDEFVVMLAALSHDAHVAAKQAESIAEKVRNALRVPITLDTGEAAVVHCCGASIGVTLFSGSDHPDEIIRRADTAMYHIKNNGGNSIHVTPIAFKADCAPSDQKTSSSRR